jgi:hypothetical protein
MLERHMLGKFAAMPWIQREMAGLTGGVQIQP